MCITNVPCYSLTCWLKRRDSHQYLNGLFFRGRWNLLWNGQKMPGRTHFLCHNLLVLFPKPTIWTSPQFCQLCWGKKVSNLNVSEAVFSFYCFYYSILLSPPLFFSLSVHTSRKAQHIVGLPGKTVKTANVWSDSIIVSLLQGMSRRMQGCNVVLNQLKWTNGQEVCLSNPCATGG